MQICNATLLFEMEKSTKKKSRVPDKHNDRNEDKPQANTSHFSAICASIEIVGPPANT